MADNDPVEWRLLDDDFSTVLGILPASDGNLYLELNEPGSGALRIPLAAPIASQITEGQFIQCNYRGAARGGFFVDNIRKEEADSQEGAGRWLAVSGRGALAILDDAIVWDSGTGASTRTFTGTKAGILVTLINENKARGIITNVEMSFDATEDTTEDAWTDDEDLELTVGRSLLDILREFSKAGGIDFTVDIETNGDFTLNAYKDGIGTNKSSTIYFRVGLNCEEVKEERVGSQVKNDMLIKYRDGFVRVSDSTSASTYRRRAKIINIEAAQSTQSATTFGAAQLEIEKDPRRSIPIAVYDGVEPNVFLDYILGDFVTLDRFGTETSDRIVGLQLSFDDAGIAHVIISLNDIITENNIKFGRDLEWLLKQWNTARDSKLLEARFWAELGLSTDTITTIHAIYRSGNTLYVAGGFLGIGGVLSPGVIQYDIPSATWSIISLANNFNGTAYTVLYHNGVVYAGGNSSNVYAFTTSWAAIGIGSFLSSVYALATDGEDIYAGGDFTSMGGASGEIARYDVSENTWVTMGTTPGSTCYTLLWHNGELYAGGLFGVEKWNGSSWSTVGAVGGTVYSLASRGSEIIAGGAFTGGVKVWDGSAWSLLGGGVNGTVRAVTVYLTDVYIGGEFTDAGSYVARYNGLWDTLDGGTNNIVYALEIDDNQTLFAGGTFTVAGDKAINKIGAYYVSFAGLLDYLEKNKGMFDLAAAIHGATAKTSMTGNDEFGMWDSITGLLRKITWSNMLLSIKTYTDTLYGSSTPAGSDTHVQYNDDGAFGGDAGFRYDATNKVVKIGENEFNVTDNGVLLQGGDTNSVGHFMETLGTGIASYITGIRGRGEVGDPEPVQADDVIFRMRGRAYDGSGVGQTSAEVRLVATETHSSTEHGAKAEIYATPNGSTSLTLAARFTGDGMGYQYLSGITLADLFGSTEWEPETVYSAGDAKFYNDPGYGLYYVICKTGHTSDAVDFWNDIANWNIVFYFMEPDAEKTFYTVDNYEDWIDTPSFVSGALDELAARTRRLEAGGWVELSESWSYASASTITVPSDATTRFRKGMRIRFKQGGGYKYYTLISCTSTVLTVDVNTDYTVANSAITEIAVSFQDKPIGFPDYFNFSPSWTNLTVGNGSILARKVLGTDGMCNFNIRFEWGGTSSISGAVSITPSPAANGYSGSLDYVACGNVSLIDAGVALYMGAAVLRQTGVIEVRAINAAGTYAAWAAISSTVPFTWATTGTPDLMNIDGKYRY